MRDPATAAGSPPSHHDVRRAQKLRLRRMLWGFEVGACNLLMVLGLTIAGALPRARTLEYLGATFAVNLGFLALLLSGLNLRLREPSMTAAQITVSIGPAVYIMYFIEAPEARAAFLLMFATAVLFGMFALSERAMLAVGGMGVAAYVGLLGLLAVHAPERVDLRIEAIIVFAYSAVLAIIARLGSFIAGLRNSLRERNSDLEQAVLALEELAMKDPLTGLLNRRSIMRLLSQEAARIRRRGPADRRLSICMIDVDDFKGINDTLGHQAGDEVLRRIAEALAATTRESDACGRLGGEEFILVLPESDLDMARLACERLRRTIREVEIPDLPGVRVTVSVGVAAHEPPDDVETTVRRADEALYRAKSAGRDRVVVAEPPEHASGAPLRIVAGRR